MIEQFEGVFCGIVVMFFVVELMWEWKKFLDQIVVDVLQEFVEQGFIFDFFQIKGIIDKVGYIQFFGVFEIQVK